MDLQNARRRLLDIEHELSARVERERAQGRDQRVDIAADTGNLSVADEAAADEFSDGERNATQLAEVRAALGRIDAGTFGACIVDGGPIEPARLEAAPWTPYCLKHQEEIENAPPMP